MNFCRKTRKAAALLLTLLLTGILAGCGAETPAEPTEAENTAAQTVQETASEPEAETVLSGTEETRQPEEPENQNVDLSQEKTCYLTISCRTILDNMDSLEEGKEGLVPEDGLLFPRQEVMFHPGESVFDVLQRVTREHKIHLDASFTPLYNSAYIKGLGNLYEFDCGAASGWMYSVNGWHPDYGVSRYEVQEQDEIVFSYTCDLGRDLGADGMGGI